MKKVYRLEGLCCANCAKKIEDAVKKIPGVNSAKLNFVTTKLIVESDLEIDQEVKKIINSIESDIEVR